MLDFPASLSRQPPPALAACGGACLNNLSAIGTFLSAIDLVYPFDGVSHFGPDALVFDWLVLQKLNRFNQTEFSYERRRFLANLVMEAVITELGRESADVSAFKVLHEFLHIRIFRRPLGAICCDDSLVNDARLAVRIGED
jgi:hypothetical protein